ncbi:UDP-glucose:glycoprotein glucosyltransferase 2 [Cichlidogyrus casuarinus]|uniref:UDP-glucose:glycoprotein glucosyltransferase 2 n=1 Tax=Cichlidogyrus casuarinus TaxID=1844966 RepID=A0ABD2PX25_9PLAT
MVDCDQGPVEGACGSVGQPGRVAVRIAHQEVGFLPCLQLLFSFYRYVWDPESIKTNRVARARFEYLPGRSLFTLAIDAQQEWMISAVRADHDMDNIKLAQQTSKTDNYEVSADYQLDYLIVEGHCLDEVTMQPPRGLQFDLGTTSHPHVYDTIVMANLGYFQLKAAPGAWNLQLHEGLSEQLYNIIE